MLKVDPRRAPRPRDGGRDDRGTGIFHAAGLQRARRPPGRTSRRATCSSIPTRHVQALPRREAPADARRASIPSSRGVARLPDGRIRAVAVPWIAGQILGAFDLIGRREDDPNDRIPHEHRRSLRASWVLFAWLVRPRSRRRSTRSTPSSTRAAVTSCGTTSSTSAAPSARRRHYAQGPQQDGEYPIEVGRTLRRAVLARLLPAAVSRIQGARGCLAARSTRSTRRSGTIPPRASIPTPTAPNRKVPPHMRHDRPRRVLGREGRDLVHRRAARRRRRDGAARAARRRLSRARARVRRDIIGRRYLRAMAAVENPVVTDDGAPALLRRSRDRARLRPSPARRATSSRSTDGNGVALPRSSSKPWARAPASRSTAQRRQRLPRRPRRERLAGRRRAAPHEPVGKAVAHSPALARARVHRFVVVGLERDE